MKTTNYFNLMSIKWGCDFYNSEAYVYTHNIILRKLCHLYLKLIGFVEV